MSDLIPYLTLGFSALTAVFALLVFLGFGRRTGPSTANLADTFSGLVRGEADRTRGDFAEQARTTREELGGAFQRFQDSTFQRMDAGIEGLRTPVAQLGQKLDDDIARMGQDAVASRETLRAAIETRLETYGDRQGSAARDLREELTGSFGRTNEQLSNTLKQLGEQQHERLDKVVATTTDLTDRQAHAQEALRQTVEARLDTLRTENSAKLDQIRQTVDEKLQTALEKRLGESFRTVSEQLERVYQGLGEMQALATGVGDLKRVLTNVKTRGTWAEVQLGMLLDQFLTPEQYVPNAQIKKGSAERVEFAIRFTGREADGDLLLPIDAKFPNEDYERLVQAAERADADGVEQAALALEARVKSFAKSISDKYIDPPTTTDFAILYLPTDGLFAEVLRRRGLHETLLREFRVAIAGPTTLASMLNAFQMGFRSLAIQKRSSEVWQILGAVRAEFTEHGKVVVRLQKQIDAARNTIEALGTRTRAMNRKLKDVETLPISDAEVVLGLSPAALAAAEREDDEEAGEDADTTEKTLFG